MAAAIPIIDNLKAPEIAPHFTPIAQAAPKKQIDYGKIIYFVFVRSWFPLWWFERKSYVGFRANAVITKKANKDLAIALSIFLFLTYLVVDVGYYLSAAGLASLNNKSVPEYRFLEFTLWNVFKLWIPFSLAMNSWAASRYAKPNFRAYQIKFNTGERASIRRQLGNRLNGKAQLREIARAGWKVDYWKTDARIHWTEFPNDRLNVSYVGTSEREWIPQLYGDAGDRGHDAVFGDDVSFDKQNFVRVLVKALLGDPNTALVMADGNAGAGFSFAEYSPLQNVALCTGVAKSLVGIESVWNEMKVREALRHSSGAKKFYRIGLCLDGFLSGGAVNFWPKGEREDDVSNRLRRISHLLSEIIDNGKMHNIHVIAVHDASLLGYSAWQAMRTRFKAWATFFKRTFNKKVGDKIVEKDVETHKYPYMDMISLIWKGSLLMMKAPYLPEADFINYVKDSSDFVSQDVFDFVEKVRITPISN